jgi:hypothetical protein
LVIFETDGTPAAVGVVEVFRDLSEIVQSQLATTKLFSPANGVPKISAFASVSGDFFQNP